MRALYINLDRSPERRQWIERQAVSLGLDLERISAMDGALLHAAPATISVGALACFHSHRKAWEMVADGDDRYVAIFEDDVHMSPDLPRFLADMSWIPDDADIVHLERSRERCVVINAHINAFGRTLYRTVSENSGTAGYLMSRSCAYRLVQEFTEIDEEFDITLFDRNMLSLTIYKIEPALCIQDEFLEGSRFASQIARQPRPKPSAGKFRREIGRQVKRLKRAVIIALDLKAPVRIRVGFR